MATSGTEAASTSSTLIQKIIIPVITTVLGATAIYFLGFNKKSPASAADIEKATVNAWQSMVSTYNLNYKNSKSISAEYYEKIAKAKGFEELGPLFVDFKTDLFKETKKLKGDLENILKKDDNIDDAFVSMLNRALDNIKDEETKTTVFVDNLVSLAKSNIDEQEKREKWQQEAEQFMAMEKKMTERSATEAEDISQVLSKKYNRPFDLNELLSYVDLKKEKDKEPVNTVKKEDNGTQVPETGNQPPADPNKGTEIKENLQDNDNPNNNTISNQTQPTVSGLAGQWEMTGGQLELSRNGEMYWTFEGKGYTYGDWKLMDGKIRMNATNPDTKVTYLVVGKISNYTARSFTLTAEQGIAGVFTFRKKTDY